MLLLAFLELTGLNRYKLIVGVGPGGFMSAEMMEQGIDEAAFRGDFFGALTIEGEESYPRDSLAARNRLSEVVNAPYIMERLSASALERAIRGWSPDSKRSVQAYLLNDKKGIDEATLLEVDASLRKAMTDHAADALGAYSSQRAYPLEVVRPVDEEQWRLSAACRGMDSKVFFPEREDGSVPRGKAKEAAMNIARSVCESCLVSAQCLEAAYEKDEEYGVWAGREMEDDEEVLLRRQRNRKT